MRCRLTQQPGRLGRLLAAIGDAGGLIGEIRIVTMGGSAMVRDITVYADDLRHIDRLVAAVRGVPETELLEVRDEVLEMHQGGNIAIRSRFDISSLATLRRVYTPGVAEVSLKIKAVDANVPRITREMLVAAAEAIAGFAPPGDIVLNPLDKDLHRTVARAVARVAIQQGLNRDDLTGYFD